MSTLVPPSTPPGAGPAASSRPGSSLDAVFRPRSVAVIGASREPGSIGGIIFANLLKHGFTGAVYPVNPKAASVQSVRAYPSITDVPDPVDLAVIVVPWQLALGTLEACGQKGVRAAVIITAGFKEVGGEGVERERALVECARRHGMRIVGPNCLGVLNTEAGFQLDATFSPIHPPAGHVAFSSQSGALGLAILETALALNVGISQFVSVGNKADVSGNDLLEFWEHDENTRVILLYLESFGNPRRFRDIAMRVGRTKPIVAVKSGRTRAGQRAAASHTGSMAGADTAVEALCAQAGVIRTNTIEELFDVAMVLAHQPPPRGRRVAIVTNAGGPGIMASDACETHGLEIPSLSEDTLKALREFLPPEASTRNPVDMIASATPASFEKATRLLLCDPNVDAVLTIFVPPIPTLAQETADGIVRGAKAGLADLAARGEPAKPVLGCFMGVHGVPGGAKPVRTGTIPSFSFPSRRRSAGAGGEVEPLARAARGHGGEAGRRGPRTRSRRDPRRARAARRRRPRGRALVHARRDAGSARGLRRAHAGERVRATAEAAAAAADRIGYPVALKLASDTLTHKTEVGGVALDLRSADEVEDAFVGMQRRLANSGLEGAMRGAHVQAMAGSGLDTLVGVTRDPSFGPLVAFGLGGTLVELMGDVVFRGAPITDRDSREMVRAIRGAKMFGGWRGAPPADVAAIEATLLRISQLVSDCAEIAEMDVNPLRVFEPGQGAVALDARISVRAV